MKLSWKIVLTVLLIVTLTVSVSSYIKMCIRDRVCAEASLRDGVVRQPHGDLGGSDGVAAVCDVGEGTAMYESGGMFQRLNQVGLQSVLQEGSHSALGLQIAGRDGLAFPGCLLYTSVAA